MGRFVRLYREFIIKLGEPVGIAFIRQRDVSLHPLSGMAFLVIHLVLLKHHRQAQFEHFQAQHVLEAVGLHVSEVGMVKIGTGLSWNDIVIAYTHPVWLFQCFEVAIAIKYRIGIALDADSII